MPTPQPTKQGTASAWGFRVVDGRPQLEPPAARGEVVADGAGVGYRPREPIQLGHDERAAAADGRERLIQAGALPVRAGEAYASGGGRLADFRGAASI